MKSNTSVFKIVFIFFIANAIGDCTGDSFIVSGTNNNVPMICGENSGQHSKFAELRGSFFLGYPTLSISAGAMLEMIGMTFN